MRARKNIIYRHILAVIVIFTTGIFLYGCGDSRGGEKMQEEAISPESEGEFTSMFDGKTLDGWEGDTTFWHVEDGKIVGNETEENSALLKANTFLIWQKEQPSNFVLEAEYRISEGGNSGIQYRSELVDGVPFGMKGYQLDIDGGNTYTGQNYEERGRTILAFPGQKVTLPAVSGPVSEYAKGNVWTAAILDGTPASRDSLRTLINKDWNTIRIVADGNHLQHYINDVLMCDVTDDDTANRKSKGLIGLQLHAGHVMKVEFRNLKIKELK